MPQNKIGAVKITCHVCNRKVDYELNLGEDETKTYCKECVRKIWGEPLTKDELPLLSQED